MAFAMWGLDSMEASSPFVHQDILCAPIGTCLLIVVRALQIAITDRCLFKD